MYSIFKKILLLWSLLFTSFLFADGTDIGIHISDATVDEGSGKMIFTVTIDELPLSLLSSVGISFETLDSEGTATAGVDYVARQSNLLSALYFTPYSSSLSKTVEIDILDDNIYEGAEYFYVQFSTTSNGYVIDGNGKAKGTIVDNDTAPLEIHTSTQTISEGDSATSNMNFTIYLNQVAPSGGVTVNYTTANNTAIAGDDYIATTGSVTIPAGQNYVYVSVPIVGDLTPEAQEEFYFNISSSSVGTVVTPSVSGYIYDNDTVQVNISSSDVQEGNIGDSNQMEFKIFLTKPYPLSTPLTINYETQDGSSPSATAGVDYQAKSGSVTFNQGETERIINITVLGDDTLEPDENIKMVISGSSNIINTNTQSQILNDDGSFPTINFTTSEVRMPEGNSGQKDMNFTVTLDKATTIDTTFNYEEWDITAQNSDNDYVYTSGTYTIPAGETTATIAVPIKGDTKIESDEEFYFVLTNLVNLTAGTTNKIKGIIENDDGSTPILEFTDTTYSIEEGNSGVKNLDFTLTLNIPALAGSSFSYATQAINDNIGDYTSVPTTSYVFSGGETNVTLSVNINGDTDIEGDEAFYLNIFNESNLTLSGTSTVKGTIINDDGNYPTINFDQTQYSILEGESGSKDLNLTLTLNAPALIDTQIEYYTQDITAQDGSSSSKDSDYNPLSGTLIIPQGSTTASIVVTINGDKNIEPDEDFYLFLENPVHLTLNSTNSKITILNDDVHNEEPFVCDDHMYLSSSINRSNPTSLGKMWVHQIDTTQNPFDFLVLDDEGSSQLYNALAYSDTDNYIYGLYFSELIKLSQTGKVINLGNITGLPTTFSNKQLFAGAIYGDYYYVSGPGQDYDKIFKIKLSDKSASEINLDAAISLLDFSFTPDGKYLHGILDGGSLVKIDITSGHVEKIGTNHTGYKFDSTFSDANGRFFANDSLGNGFFEFDLNTGNKRFLSDSQKAEFNDGANCLKGTLVFNDYGDAPSSYGTARHDIANGIFMGDEVDHDINAYNNTDATGDDINGIDDEDGVTLLDGSDINGSYFPADSLQELNISVSKAGYLNAWLDYGIDGVFDVSDKIISAQALVAGEQIISFNVPNMVTLNKTTYIRFRYSSTPTLDATQNTTDGEVEDYAVKFGSAFTPLKGTFNIERTNSATDTIGSDLRNAWYTQIVGRDFDYSILFYDESFLNEQTIDNVTVKVELVNTENNVTLYERYAHIQNTPAVSRIDTLSGVNAPIDDLATLPASKDVHFRISYGIDDSGAIIQADCVGDPKVCFENFTKTRTDKAQDNFAIRPEQFAVTIADGNTVLASTPSPLRLAAGYDYNLTVLATQYNDINRASLNYNASLTRLLTFIGSSSCANRDNNISTETFKDGKNISDTNSSFFNLFEIANVGLYTLNFEDKDWTFVDNNKAVPDCIVDSAETSTNPNLLSGCEIHTTQELNISSYPHHFAMNFTLNNLPNNGHDNFIYMSELNAGYNEVAMQLKGTITAQNEENITCTNFINMCMAEEIIVSPDILVKSEDGINQLLQTSYQENLTPKRENISIRRMVRYNDDINDTNFLSMNYITDGLVIPESKFLIGENNGSMSLELRYNIDKHHSRTTNPVQIAFKNLTVHSLNSQSSAHGIVDHYTPSGGAPFTNNVRNFYFTQVAPDLTIFNKVNVDVTPTIRTPLNVDIFCDKNNSYCDETNLTFHSNRNASPRVDEGWYLSTEHDENHDGQIIQLNDTPDIVTIAPDTNITLPQGRNGIIINTFTQCIPPLETTVVTITPSPVLLYHPNPANHGLPTYTIPCQQNPSAWSGIGETGNIVETNTTTSNAGKLDW